MTAPLVFMDTETTGLSLDDDIWEFAAVRREPDGTETELHLFIEHDMQKCKQLPPSFRDDHDARYRNHREYTRAQAAVAIGDLVRNGKPHIVGAVPNFDTERITLLMQAWRKGWTPTWHYHLIDVENLAVGFLAASRLAPSYGPTPVPDLSLPWDSEALSQAVGVDPARFERHTAMGDVRWAMAIYDAVMGRSRDTAEVI